MSGEEDWTPAEREFSRWLLATFPDMWKSLEDEYRRQFAIPPDPEPAKPAGSI